MTVYEVVDANFSWSSCFVEFVIVSVVCLRYEFLYRWCVCVGVVDAARGERVLSCAGGVDGSGSPTSGKYAGVDGVRNVWS